MYCKFTPWQWCHFLRSEVISSLLHITSPVTIIPLLIQFDLIAFLFLFSSQSIFMSLLNVAQKTLISHLCLFNNQRRFVADFMLHLILVHTHSSHQALQLYVTHQRSEIVLGCISSALEIYSGQKFLYWLEDGSRVRFLVFDVCCLFRFYLGLISASHLHCGLSIQQSLKIKSRE